MHSKAISPKPQFTFASLCHLASINIGIYEITYNSFHTIQQSNSIALIVTLNISAFTVLAYQIHNNNMAGSRGISIRNKKIKEHFRNNETHLFSISLNLKRMKNSGTDSIDTTQKIRVFEFHSHKYITHK